MSIEKIKKVLQEKIGLYSQSIGESSVRRAIEIRLRAHDLSSIEKYFELMSSTRTEFDALIEEIVVPETWFFRYKRSFVCISDHVAERIKSATQLLNRPRILSFPCSTGEEPYSILIQLLESKISLEKVVIDAVDISKRSLKKAQHGMYSLSAFKETDAVVLKRYFSNCDGDYQIHDELRDHVNFKQNNFLVGSISPRPAYYDVILCRNLLIYFDSELQQSALEKLYRALKPGGLLILGHAESSTINSQYFRRYGDERAYAFHRISQTKKSTNKNHTKTEEKYSSESDWKKIFGQNVSDNTQSIDALELSRQYDGVEEISLRLLEKMVRNGQWVEAESLIDKRLQKKPDDPTAYYLFALIKHSVGDLKLAESILKKAIYLDPNHEKSIELLKSIAQENEDLESVSKFDRRLKRIRANKEK